MDKLVKELEHIVRILEGETTIMRMRALTLEADILLHEVNGK